MKKIILSLSFLLSVGVGSSGLIGQCNSDNFSNACIPKLAGGFNFLKSYKIEGEGGGKKKEENSFLFPKGKKKIIKTCGNGKAPDGIVVTLFDPGPNKVGSSK